THAGPGERTSSMASLTLPPQALTVGPPPPVCVRCGRPAAGPLRCCVPICTLPMTCGCIGIVVVLALLAVAVSFVLQSTRTDWRSNVPPPDLHGPRPGLFPQRPPRFQLGLSAFTLPLASALGESRALAALAGTVRHVAGAGPNRLGGWLYPRCYRCCSRGRSG